MLDGLGRDLSKLIDEDLREIDPDANYKRIQRFLAQTNTKAALQRLFWEDAPFVLGDPTEIPRPRAKRTSYVGLLKDGQTRGFWLLVLATPFRGRAIPVQLCYLLFENHPKGGMLS